MIPKDFVDPEFGSIRFEEISEFRNSLSIVPETHQFMFEPVFQNRVEPILMDAVLGRSSVILNLGDYGPIHIETVNLILRIQNSINRNAGAFVVVAGNENVHYLMNAMGWDTILTVVKTLDEAYLRLSNRNPNAIHDLQKRRELEQFLRARNLLETLHELESEGEAFGDVAVEEAAVPVAVETIDKEGVADDFTGLLEIEEQERTSLDEDLLEL